MSESMASALPLEQALAVQAEIWQFKQGIAWKVIQSAAEAQRTESYRTIRAHEQESDSKYTARANAQIDVLEAFLEGLFGVEKDIAENISRGPNPGE